MTFFFDKILPPEALKKSVHPLGCSTQKSGFKQGRLTADSICPFLDKAAPYQPLASARLLSPKDTLRASALEHSTLRAALYSFIFRCFA